MTRRALNLVPFVSVANMMRLVNAIGVERFLTELAGFVEEDFRRWPTFEKTARMASHSADGVIELMPTSDGVTYGFKYVNGHPKNMREGRQTVTAFGLLAEVSTGYPVLLSEMTILTALRTAATSAVAAKHLARPGSRSMAIIGNGAQSEFQALGFKALVGVDRLRLYDIDRWASEKCAVNLARYGFDLTICASAEDAVEGVDIVTTVTADKHNATVLTDNLVGAGQHINAVGGDCPGKTELHRDILLRSAIFVEYPPQTRIEGEIQQLAARSSGDRAVAGDRRRESPAGDRARRSPCSIRSASPSRTSPPCATSIRNWRAATSTRISTCSPTRTNRAISSA